MPEQRKKQKKTGKKSKTLLNCEHGRVPYYCKECPGKGICIHNCRRYACKVCNSVVKSCVESVDKEMTSTSEEEKVEVSTEPLEEGVTSTLEDEDLAVTSPTETQEKGQVVSEEEDLGELDCKLKRLSCQEDWVVTFWDHVSTVEHFWDDRTKKEGQLEHEERW
eukprot:138162-Rhodomonas_salina.1